jgi:hypothetical protein
MREDGGTGGAEGISKAFNVHNWHAVFSIGSAAPAKLQISALYHHFIIQYPGNMEFLHKDLTRNSAVSRMPGRQYYESLLQRKLRAGIIFSGTIECINGAVEKTFQDPCFFSPELQVFPERISGGVVRRRLALSRH